MIIAINGRIRSGKDTVTKIIQDLTRKPIEGYVMKDGDDFVPALGGSDWQNRKFAAKLKQIASILLGDPHFVERWESGDPVYRNEYLPEWSMSRREFLLKLGTDCMRDHFHRDVHVISTLADYTEEQKWVISDLRFGNEFDGASKIGAILIRVNRNFEFTWPEQWQKYVVGKTYPNNGDFIQWLKENDPEVFKIVSHPSEMSLMAHRFKYEIVNNWGMADLINQVKQILRAEKII